jgi:hypothetical protein
MDVLKLNEVIKEEFKDLSDHLIELLKKVFAGYKVPVDFNVYCEVIMRFIAIDEFMCKEILFNILDINRDKKLCETDLFNAIYIIETTHIYGIIRDDI